MAVVTLKEIKLHGSGTNGTWSNNTNVQICFTVVPIGSGFTVPTPGQWHNFTGNPNLTFLADGYLSLFVDGQYGGCDLIPPVSVNGTPYTKQADINCGLGTASVKFRVT